MAEITIPTQWQLLCATPNSSSIHECINNVFRRLLANLLLDFHNPKFRQVKKDNKAVQRTTQHLPHEFVAYLFNSLGFVERADAFVFEGSEESLKRADQVFSALEDLMDREKLENAERDLQQLKSLAVIKAPHYASPSVTPPPASGQPSRLITKVSEREQNQADQLEGTKQDTKEGTVVAEAVRKTLLNTGRIRNSFFEGKDLTIRTMRHGRVYACTEKCANQCIEVHWHLLTGRNILYSHLAHLSADGTELIHLGVEHGYQYNTLPGSPHFGKMIHFSEKLTDSNGKLLHIKHDDKPSTCCIYCGRPFSELLL